MKLRAFLTAIQYGSILFLTSSWTFSANESIIDSPKKAGGAFEMPTRSLTLRNFYNYLNYSSFASYKAYMNSLLYSTSLRALIILEINILMFWDLILRDLIT